MEFRNPFEFEAANNLSDDRVADYFIDDHNYSRFIQSRRNVFVIGERGSGKTMALLYSSARIQRLIALRASREPTLDHIGIYVPCNTPLTYKPEFDLLDEFLSSVLSEHLFVLSIAHSIVSTLVEIPNLLANTDERELRAELSLVFGTNLATDLNFFDSIRIFLETQIRDTQRTAVSRQLGAYHEETFSFGSVVLPLLTVFKRRIPSLKASHFLFLMDDAQALNNIQLKALNSWIAFRDRSLFSFKVATTKVSRATRRTASGGSILEGHDYTTIDLERPLHNRNSGFYQLARKIISRRLADVGIDNTPELFFPVNPAMQEDLEKAKNETKAVAVRKFGKEDTKAVRDFVYKYARARYFKSRPSKANRPPYSGFETMVFISTGVIRNLLEPCYWMFDQAMSRAGAAALTIKYINPTIQTEVILERSDAAWKSLQERLSNDIEGCSIEDGRRAHRLLDALATHFRDRLFSESSEPSAVSFTVSRRDSLVMGDLHRLLDILQSAQMIYVRFGPAKDSGRREPYYVPNRILWPSRGLDPQGQHARVSLTSDSLWHAAETGSLQLPTIFENSDQPKYHQEKLWDED